MIALDTNVISPLMEDEPDRTIVVWLDRFQRGQLWLTAISLFELRYGIETLATGRRRHALEHGLARVVDQGFAGRILPLDAAAASIASVIAAESRRSGRPAEIRDTLIAGIVVSQGADFATRNVRHFDDLDVRVINPWADAVS